METGICQDLPGMILEAVPKTAVAKVSGPEVAMQGAETYTDSRGPQGHKNIDTKSRHSCISVYFPEFLFPSSSWISFTFMSCGVLSFRVCVDLFLLIEAWTLFSDEQLVKRDLEQGTATMAPAATARPEYHAHQRRVTRMVAFWERLEKSLLRVLTSASLSSLKVGC